jgi:hypothetical protein
MQQFGGINIMSYYLPTVLISVSSAERRSSGHQWPFPISRHTHSWKVTNEALV